MIHCWGGQNIWGGFAEQWSSGGCLVSEVRNAQCNYAHQDDQTNTGNRGNQANPQQAAVRGGCRLRCTASTGKRNGLTRKGCRTGRGTAWHFQNDGGDIIRRQALSSHVCQVLRGCLSWIGLQYLANLIPAGERSLVGRS